MCTTTVRYWQEDGWYLGYLIDFPTYWTQGEDWKDFIEHLDALHQDLMDNPDLRASAV